MIKTTRRLIQRLDVLSPRTMGQCAPAPVAPPGCQARPGPVIADNWHGAPLAPGTTGSLPRARDEKGPAQLSVFLSICLSLGTTPFQFLNGAIVLSQLCFLAICYCNLGHITEIQDRYFTRWRDMNQYNLPSVSFNQYYRGLGTYLQVPSLTPLKWPPPVN